MSQLGKQHRTFGTDWVYITAVVIAVSIGVRVVLSVALKMSYTIANPLTLLASRGGIRWRSKRTTGQ